MQDIEVVKVVKIWGLINSYLMGQIGITAKSYLSWVSVCPGTINIYNTLTLIKNMNILFYIYNFKKFTQKSLQIFSLFLNEASTLKKLYLICNICFWILAQNLCSNIFSFFVQYVCISDFILFCHSLSIRSHTCLDRQM